MRRLHSVTVPGPAGALEALLEEPGDEAPREAALVCHPHPRYGGTLHNKVVYRLARGLRQAGAVVLRFNFRGVGRSAGEYAGGVGEIEDARAALAWLRQRYPALPFTLAGFSFGARVVLSLACDLPDPPRRVIALGFPTATKNTAHLLTCTVPKVFIQSTHDQYGPRAELEQLFEGWAEPKRLVWVEASDHFFAGGLDVLEKAVLTLER